MNDDKTTIDYLTAENEQLLSRNSRLLSQNGGLLLVLFFFLAVFIILGMTSSSKLNDTRETLYRAVEVAEMLGESNDALFEYTETLLARNEQLVAQDDDMIRFLGESMNNNTILTGLYEDLIAAGDTNALQVQEIMIANGNYRELLEKCGSGDNE